MTEDNNSSGRLTNLNLQDTKKDVSFLNLQALKKDIGFILLSKGKWLVNTQGGPGNIESMTENITDSLKEYDTIIKKKYGDTAKVILSIPKRTNTKTIEELMYEGTFGIYYTI